MTVQLNCMHTIHAFIKTIQTTEIFNFKILITCLYLIIYLFLDRAKLKFF